jgi:hypothetical protein
VCLLYLISPYKQGYKKQIEGKTLSLGPEVTMRDREKRVLQASNTGME